MSHTCVTSLFSDGVRVLEVEERTVGPRRVLITVVGEVDHSTYPLLGSSFTRTWEVRPVAVAVDLREVTFLNAAGLRTLLLASGTARALGVPMVLQAGSGQITRLLTMVGFGEQMLPSSDVQAVLGTGSHISRPVLRLVSPTDVAHSVAPAAGASGTGQPVGGGPHVVQALSLVTGRDGAAANGMHAVAAATTRPARAEDRRVLEAAGAARSAHGPSADRRAVLWYALRGRELVGRATGMLMQRDSITADQALDILTQVSKSRKQSIVAVAEELTGTHRV